MTHSFDTEYNWIKDGHEYTRNQLVYLRNGNLTDRWEDLFYYKDIKEKITLMIRLASGNYGKVTAKLYNHV